MRSGAGRVLVDPSKKILGGCHSEQGADCPGSRARPRTAQQRDRLRNSSRERILALSRRPIRKKFYGDYEPIADLEMARLHR